jgi:hypothetical protein
MRVYLILFQGVLLKISSDKSEVLAYIENDKYFQYWLTTYNKKPDDLIDVYTV